MLSTVPSLPCRGAQWLICVRSRFAIVWAWECLWRLPAQPLAGETRFAGVVALIFVVTVGWTLAFLGPQLREVRNLLLHSLDMIVDHALELRGQVIGGAFVLIEQGFHILL